MLTVFIHNIDPMIYNDYKMIKFLCVILIICGVASSVTCLCDEKLPELRFLSNVDKLLNQSFVKIVDGVRLRKKSNILETQGNSTSACNEIPRNFIVEIDKKLGNVLNTHVLEFDLAKMLSTGKNKNNAF